MVNYTDTLTKKALLVLYSFVKFDSHFNNMEILSSSIAIDGKTSYAIDGKAYWRESFIFM